MKNRIFIILSFLFCSELGYAQIKLKDIPYDLSSINQRDNNGKQGVWFFYDKSDSTVSLMQYFVNDTPNGYYERFWDNGNVSEKGFFKNGEPDSTFIAYWENGKKRGEGNYKNGLIDGIFITYDVNGQITTRIKFIFGEEDRNYEEYYVDSNIIWDSESADKIDTVKTASMSKWNKNYAIYVNGILIKEIIFYKNVARIENFYEKTLLVKRIVYYRKKPYNIEKIFYYQNEILSKTELYDKKAKPKRKFY